MTSPSEDETSKILRKRLFAACRGNGIDELEEIFAEVPTLSPTEETKQSSSSGIKDWLEGWDEDFNGSSTEKSKARSQVLAFMEFVNTSRDEEGRGALHIAAEFGSDDAIFYVTNQSPVEMDYRDRKYGETTLHKAVRYANAARSEQERLHGFKVVDIVLEQGCDPRIKNTANFRPIDLLNRDLTDIRQLLEEASQNAAAPHFAIGDTVLDDDDDDGRDGPGSESD